MIVRRKKDDELTHHGIKGQRWGVRRYQNTDGSLTTAGRSRYGSSDGKKRSTAQQQYNQLHYDLWQVEMNSGRHILTNTHGLRKLYNRGKTESKGVHKRGKGLSTSATSGYYNGNNYFSAQGNTKMHYYTRYDDDMEPNVARFRDVNTANGTGVIVYGKDEESLKNFGVAMAAIMDNQGETEDSVETALHTLMMKYGELKLDMSKWDKTNPYAIFTNVSKKDQMNPLGAMTQDVKSANVAEENIGKNGMPSDVAQLARTTLARKNKKNFEAANPKGNTVKGSYVGNGAPSNVKKSIYMKAKRRTNVTNEPGTNGMPTNINNYNVYDKYSKKKK